jgi:lipid-A-disaccharide synthase
MQIYMSAGELSGDHLGASLASALLSEDPDLTLEGYGGQEMERAGVKIVYPLPSLAVMGVVRVIRHLPTLRRLLRDTESYLAETRPKAVVLIDYPGWHFVVAKVAKRLGIPVVQFVAPQLWAWAPWRIRKVRQRVDRLLVLLPFEEVYFRDRGVEARYVGHPLVDRLARIEAALPPRQERARRLLGILPGSRHQEWSRLLPVFLQSARSLCGDGRQLEIRVGCAKEEYQPEMEKMVQASGLRARVEVGTTHAIQRDAALVLTSSGTSTLECTYFLTPMVVAYPGGRLTRWFARVALTAPYFALTNLLAGRELVPELLVTGDAAPAVTRAAAEILDNPERRSAMVAGLEQVRASLITENPSLTAAREILSVVRKKGEEKG